MDNHWTMIPVEELESLRRRAHEANEWQALAIGDRSMVNEWDRLSRQLRQAHKLNQILSQRIAQRQ